MEGELIKALITGIPGGAVAGVLLYFYIGERSERRELQKQVIDLLKASIEGDVKVADALNGIRTEIAARKAA